MHIPTLPFDQDFDQLKQTEDRAFAAYIAAVRRTGFVYGAIVGLTVGLLLSTVY